MGHGTGALSKKTKKKIGVISPSKTVRVHTGGRGQWPQGTLRHVQGLFGPPVNSMVQGSPYARCRLPHPLPLQATPVRHSGISQILLVCRRCRRLHVYTGPLAEIWRPAQRCSRVASHPGPIQSGRLTATKGGKEDPGVRICGDVGAPG